MNLSNSNGTEREQDILYRLWKAIPANLKACFFTGVFAGLLTHLYTITNKLPNWDDLGNLLGFGGGEQLGRWFLPVVHSFFAKWSVPGINAVMAILLLSLAAAFVCATLKLHSVTACAVTGLMMVTFPTVVSTMTFMFTVSSYAFAILMITVAIYLVTRFSKGWIPGAILLVLGIAVYQSYFSYAAGLLVLSLLLELLSEDAEEKKIFFKGIKYLVFLGGSMGCYLLITKSGLFELSDYKGVSSMGLDLGRLPVTVARAYHRILQYFISGNYSFIDTFLLVLNIVTVMLIVELIAFLFVRTRIYKKKAGIALLVFLLLMFPLSVSSIYIMVPDVDKASTVMLFSYVLVYVALAGLMEKATEGKKLGRLPMGLTILSLCVLLLVGYSHYRLSNEAYFRTGLAFTRVEDFYNRIMVKVEEEPGYTYDQKLVILGDYWPEPNILSGYSVDGERYSELEGLATEHGLFTTGVRRQFIRTYLGINIPEVSQEETDAIWENEEFLSMPYFPEDGCVKKIGDIWVVRMAH